MNWSKRILLLVLLLALGAIVVFRVTGFDPGVTDENAPPTPTPEPTPLVFETPPVELTAVLTPLQLNALDASALQRLDLTGSTCYTEIESFIRRHPDVEVTYTVILTAQDGEKSFSIAPDAVMTEISDADFVAPLIAEAAHLPLLRTIFIVDDIAEGPAVDALRDAYPEAEVRYQIHLNGESYPYDTEELTLSGMNAASLRSLIPELERFCHLQNVYLPQADNEFSLDEALGLSDLSPLIHLNYRLSLFDHEFSLDDERLEFENLPIGNEGLEQIRALLPYMRNLKYLKLDDCGVDNKTMEKLRDDHPELKVVWRVYFGNYHTLTDTEMIWATGSSLNDDNIWVLKYCTDVKYLDLGHSLISKIEFVRYMPNLEVAIFANSWVSDIGPISECQKLEYIELFSCCVRDFSPLGECKALQHVNISHPVDRNYNALGGYVDISGLYDLPLLKRFYCTMCHVTQAQKDEIMQRHPDCEFDFSWEDPSKGAWRYNSDGSYNERYALLREQFGYDTLQQSGKTWSLYG